MISQGASLLNLSLVVAEADLKRAVEALHRSSSRELDPDVFERNGARAQPERLAIVGYGKMGKLIEQLAPEYGFAVALKLDEFNNANYEGVTAENFRGDRCGDRFLDSGGGRRKCRSASRRWASTSWSAPPAGWSSWIA